MYSKNLKTGKYCKHFKMANFLHFQRVYRIEKRHDVMKFRNFTSYPLYSDTSTHVFLMYFGIFIYLLFIKVLVT